MGTSKTENTWVERMPSNHCAAFSIPSRSLNSYAIMVNASSWDKNLFSRLIPTNHPLNKDGILLFSDNLNKLIVQFLKIKSLFKSLKAASNLTRRSVKSTTSSFGRAIIDSSRLIAILVVSFSMSSVISAFPRFLTDPYFAKLIKVGMS